MSFLSVEPQSRVVLENYSNSLLAQFDSQLRIVADRYLAFFRERRTIEATYIDSLRRLHRKAKTVDAKVDASTDSRAEPTTTRSAWDKVTDNLEREANNQQAFVDILDNDVIDPLAAFKETKDESRKRIEEDLEKSVAEYADHAENKILNLQEAYFKKYHPRFRGQQDDSGEPEREEVSDDDFRLAVGHLHSFRLRRAENLGYGYDCLEDLVFTPVTKNAILKYMDGMITASAKYDNLARSTRVEVETVLAGRDTSDSISDSDLRMSFRRALSFSIPSPTFYRNHCPGVNSDLIFGVPLVDVETNEGNVPKVMSRCMEEVEKMGLNAHGIYSKGYPLSERVLQLRRRFEREKSFSFRFTGNIHSVAMLLKRYLWDLPEPLFALSLQDYRNYNQIRAKYIENDFLVLRSKIRELHPVHKASLEALLRHLSLVVAHSDENEMSGEILAAEFSHPVLRGNKVLEDGVDMKTVVMEDLIKNVHTLFDERASMSPPVPSPHVGGSTFAFPSGSILTARLPQPPEADAIHRSVFIGVTPTSTQSSFTSLPSDTALESRFTPSPTAWPSPPLELPSSNTFVETASPEQVTHEVRGTEAFMNSPPPEVVVAEWRLRQSQLPPQTGALIIPQSPPESMLSSSSDLPLSSVVNL